MNGSAGETKPSEEQVTKPHARSEGSSSRSSSTDLSSDLSWISKRICSASLQSSAAEEMEEWKSCNNKINEYKTAVVNSGKDVKIHANSEDCILTSPILDKTLSNLDHQKDDQLGSIYWEHEVNASSPGTEDPDTGRIKLTQNGFTNGEIIETHQKHAKGSLVEEKEQTKDELQTGVSQFDSQKQVTLEDGLLVAAEETIVGNNKLSNIGRPKHVKSVRSSLDSSKSNGSNGSVRSNQFIVADAKNYTQGSISSDYKDAKMFTKEKRNLVSDSRVQHLEHRMEVLEGELREAAAVEVSLYSVVAEHGSSMTKVHAPARRLSRLYFHASKHNSKSRRSSAAKSIVSGLVLVSKACGNDVPRYDSASNPASNAYFDEFDSINIGVSAFYNGNNDTFVFQLLYFAVHYY